jgi:uncharacterized protein (DUF983 family)
MSKNWIKIEAENVRSLWCCPDCGEEQYFNPWFYEKNGTPVCNECDVDMEYDHTEVNLG